MISFNQELSFNDINIMEAKSVEAEQHYSETTDKLLVKGCKSKASSTQKEIRYICKECGKQIRKQSSINSHKRANHEGIKYPCGQCQHEATKVGCLDQHKRLVHEGIKYPCRQCLYQSISKGDLIKPGRALH